MADDLPPGVRVVKMMADAEGLGHAHDAQGECSFLLAGPDRQVAASGMRRLLPAGSADTLGERVAAFFAGQRDPSAPALLVGAIPFDRQADDMLFQPDRLLAAVPQPRPWQPGHHWQVQAQPTRAGYEQAVARALELIAQSSSASPAPGDALSKIVLSRSLLLQSDAPLDPMALSARLGQDRGVVRFVTPLPAGADGAPRHLVGATPELLLSKNGSTILSHPLAGSARRSRVAAEDRQAAQSLRQSAKDQREHRWVVEAILDILAPYCTELSAPDLPELISTCTMWHLGTRIEGRLKDAGGVSAAELAAALHPTPAVGGVSRDRAMALIPQLETYDRGFYAGAVGWTDGAGDGAWYVSLRCAEVSGRRARVYAGAGVVEGSVPAEEAAETSAKLQAILLALGVDEQGRPVPDAAATSPSA